MITPFRIFLILTAALVMGIVGISDSRAQSTQGHSGWPTGTWYLALDTEAYGLPPGFPLSGMAQIHRDGTLMFVDGGDFGQANFLATRNLPQFGSWRRTASGTIAATTLFLEADASSGEVLRWIRVQIELWRAQPGLMVGTVNTSLLPCTSPLPLPSPLTCPDPIVNADQFVGTGDPPDVPLTLRRLEVEY